MDWLSSILDMIAPRSCAVCNRRLSSSEQSLCADCYMHLPRTAFQFAPSDNIMAQLFWHITPVERAAALFYFEPRSEVARLVYAMKYNRQPEIATDMGRMMAEEMLMGGFFDDIDCLIPVPLTRRREWARGYNQSLMLARGVSQVTGLPVLGSALRRKYFRQSQTLLTAQERRANVADSFELRNAEGLGGGHALLVDDICTTGATLTACADALRPVGQLRLSFLTLGFAKS